MHPVLDDMTSGRTDQSAASAPDAAGGYEGDLASWLDGFRVLTPEAGQRTSLDVHDRPKTRSVMKGTTGDMEDARILNAHMQRHLEQTMLGALDDMVLHRFIEQAEPLAEA